MSRNTAVQKPKSVADLMELTGLGRELVKSGIVAGQLPGYKVGTRYTVPFDAYEDLRHGRWVPITPPVIIRIETITPMDPSDFTRRRTDQKKTA